MAAARHPALKLLLGLLVLAALLLEVLALVRNLGAHQRQQARAAEGLRQALFQARGALAPRLRPGGPEALAAALDAAEALLPGATLELLDPAGRALLRRGAPVAVAHWVDVRDLEASGPLGVYVVGPFPEAAPVLLGYALYPAGEARVVLRVAQPADELQRDLDERRELLRIHAASVALLLLVTLLALWSGRRAGAERAPGAGALVAYEAAMGHLRARELRLSEEHAAERLRLEQAVREKEALARAGELTAGLAHEVRNGLGTILGYARMLERAGLASELQAAAAAIREECETLASVVRRFVEYVREERLKAARFDLRRCLERVAAREERARSGAALVLVPGEPGEVWGDEELLERALENLLRNAREAAGAAGRVEVGARVDGASVEVSVCDDGPGLGSAGASALRPFRSTKPGGLGLGLPLAAKIARLHGGELRFGARAPRGLEVALRLPRDGSLVTESNAGSDDDRPAEPGRSPTGSS